RLAMITGQGLLVMIAGFLETATSSVTASWSITFLLLAAVFVMLFAWHRFSLPRPAGDIAREAGPLPILLRESIATFASFFRREHIGRILTFLLFYRFSEAQLVKLAAPFMLDGRDIGGLEMNTGAVGVAYGT